MKTKFYFFIAAIFLATNLFSQTKVMKPLTAKTVAPLPAANTVVKKEGVAKPQTKPAPTPTDLQNAVVNIAVGDDGKDRDTYLSISINDGNKRLAAYYGNEGRWGLGPIPTGEYFSGESETIPTNLDASVPTGETKLVGALPLPVLREANLLDFAGNGGSIILYMQPNGHDTWKINSFSVILYFNNDSSSPHKITWTGFTLSQDSRTRAFEFDKNFNPIQ